MIRVHVLGRSGQLAQELARAAWPADWQVAFAGRDAIDLGEPERAAAAAMERGPDLVINAAAYTAVDKAGNEPELATRINALAPAAIAAACDKRGIPFVTVSTDYVFDGNKSGPYTEEDPVNPVSAYGRSKAEAERLVRAANPRHLILRTSWVFSAAGSNFVRTMLRLARERDVVSVVADQRGKPTAARDLAAAIVSASEALLRKPEIAGTYHVANAQPTTWHDFAAAIFEDMHNRNQRIPQLRAITTADYPTAARRPANSELATGKFERTFAIALRPWRAALPEVLDELLGPSAA
jgi:dTDP-4-dehydrorhamnose reductase